MKAVTVAGAADVQAALAYAGKADLILFDAKAPPATPRRYPAATASPSTGRRSLGVKGASTTCCRAD